MAASGGGEASDRGLRSVVDVASTRKVFRRNAGLARGMRISFGPRKSSSATLVTTRTLCIEGLVTLVCCAND